MKKKQMREGNSLSSRERVFDFLITYKKEHDGNSPSLLEIGAACYLSDSTVYYHLTHLQLEGRIHVGGRRFIEITDSAWGPFQEDSSEDHPESDPPKGSERQRGGNEGSSFKITARRNR